MEYFYNRTGVSENHTPRLSDRIYTNKAYNITRIQKIRIFSEYINNHKKYFETCSADENIVIEIEKGCFNRAIKISRKKNIPPSWDYEEFDDIYHMVCGKAISYIDCSVDCAKANIIINMVIDDISRAKWLSSINYREIYPEEYRELDKRCNADSQIIKRLCTLYTCPKCKKSLCTLANRYNRSLDEGVNLTATCAWCHTQWNC